MSQVNKLGNRLRKNARRTPEDEQAYFNLRESHLSALREVMATVTKACPAYPPVGRPKTLESAVLKLRREKTRLSKMQDIAVSSSRTLLPKMRL